MRVIPALLALGCTGSAAAATNLLPNGGFSAADDLRGWDCPLSPAPIGAWLWSNDDAAADPSSGSLEIDVPAGSLQLLQSTCFRILPAAVYSFGGMGRRASGAATTWFSCTLFSDANCDFGSTPWGTTQLATEVAWASGFTYGGVLPPAANSMHCRVWVDNSGNAQDSVIRVDALFFNSDEQLFADGFEPPPQA